jgi:hypothetical protein
METKRCPRCTEAKPVSAFNGNPSAKDGLQAYCKPCAVEVAIETNLRHDRYQTPETRAKWAEIARKAELVKHCGRCGETKPASEYYPNPRTRSGLASYCKACTLESAYESAEFRGRTQAPTTRAKWAEIARKAERS